MKQFIFFILILILISKSAFSNNNTDIVVLRSSYDFSQKQYQKFNGSITLGNIGTDTIQQFNVTKLYFSQDSIFDSNDINGGSVNFSVLAPNDSITLSIIGGANQFGINADSSYKYVIVVADYRHEELEQNENNNLWVGSISIQNAKVDLTVDNFLINNSDSLHIGDLLNITVNFKNNGSDNVHNTFYEYFLSVDTIFDDGDTPIGYSNYISFNWKNIRTENVSLAIPTLVLSYKYYLFIRINTQGQEISINDYNLSNNIILLDSIKVIDKIKNSTLNFEDAFGAKSWSEDGYTWKWDNSGGDNIRNYNPHTGSGHAMSSAGYSSRLSTSSLLNIKGLWLKTGYGFNFSHLKVLGYNKNNIVTYSKSLNANDYQYDYAYITLNWVYVESIQFDFEAIDKKMPISLSYDDMDYTYLNDTITIYTSFEGPNCDKSPIRIYPNPNKGIFKIMTSGGFKNVTVKLFNINGQVVFEKSGFSGPNIAIDISQNPDGLYFIELIKDYDIFKFKIIKN